MGTVVADITMSLDGFVTGPDPGRGQGLGRGGMPLHDWVMTSKDETDMRVLAEATERSGAVVMGRRLFDIVDGPNGWNEERGYGAHELGAPPFFVVTHQAPEQVRLGYDFTFVTDGIAAAVAAARDASGERSAVIMGGGSVIAQALAADLVEELHIHLAPLLLGEGTRLFSEPLRRELIQESVRVSPAATHLTYRLA